MEQLNRNLNLIFWGVLIIIIDLSYWKTTNDSGFKIDLVNDLIGAIMIYNGVSQIGKLKISRPSYVGQMLVATVAAGIQFFFALADFVIFKSSYAFDLIMSLLSLVVILGGLRFCKAMTTLCEEKSLPKSKERWELSRKLLFWIYWIPSLVGNLLDICLSFANAKRYQWKVDLGLTAGNGFVVLIIVFLIPLIFTLYTIYEMRKEMKNNYRDQFTKNVLT